MIATKQEKTNPYKVGSESFNFENRPQVLNHINTFCVLDSRGNIHPDGKKAHGIFYRGTRYLNQLELSLNSSKPHLLSSTIKGDNQVFAVDMTNPELDECQVKEDNLHIKRRQLVSNGGFFEQIDVTNFTQKTCSFTLSVVFDADFADIFEIRGTKRNVTVPKRKLSYDKNTIIFTYKGNDNICRTTEIVFQEDDNLKIKKGTAHLTIKLGPHETGGMHYMAWFKNSEIKEKPNGVLPSFNQVKKNVQKDIRRTSLLFAGIESENENFNKWLVRSKTDLQSLLSTTPYGLYPYAGVPWYNTVFGRDAIITSMQLLWVAPSIAKDVLVFQAATQATKTDNYSDAEPGKIIHEMRFGEMANTGEVPFKRYYGTIDATPLFIMLAGMYYVRTGDLATVKKIWNNIKAAINWIDKYGDIDGDGFVEYESKTKNGLSNQGWKDSYDSIMHADGELCKTPTALCEVQGYVYAAKKYAALIALALKQEALSKTWQQDANTLKKNFNNKFWDEDLGCYVLALDGNKKPCRVIASNAGQCLFSGIATKQHAIVVAKKITGKDMFSGWGIRTLSSKEVRYNPISYHNGSVWPHDNSLIAYGMAHYNLKRPCLQIFSGIFQAAMDINNERMPELFCGFEKTLGDGPTAYPVACSPQAWAVGAVYLLLQSILGISIDALKKQVVFNTPKLPESLNTVTIRNLQLGKGHCSFELFRHKHSVGCRIINKPGDWEIIVKED